MEILKEDFEILEEFIKEWNEPKHGRELDKKIKYSQKFIAERLKKLEKEGILKTKTRGRTKEYKINNNNKQTTDIITITEIKKKYDYIKNNQKINEIITDTKQIVGIFGSQTKGTANKESDIDIFIIGNKKQNYEEKGKEYNSLISTKQFTEKEFTKMLANKQPLAKEIVKNHIIIHKTEEFTKMLAREYYGFNKMV